IVILFALDARGPNAEKQQALAVRRPDRITSSIEFWLHRPGRAAVRRNNADSTAARRYRRPTLRTYPVGNLGAIGRKTRPAAALRNEAGLTSQGRNEINSGTGGRLPLRMESYFGAIWRKFRLVLVGRI